MRKTVMMAVVFVSASMAAVANAQTQAEPEQSTATVAAGAASAKPSPSEDEKAIRLAAETFAKAYNAHDAKTLASLFAAGGEIVDEMGEGVQGRKAIERTFAAIFQSHPKSQIQITVQSIRFVSTSTAVEDGVSAVTGLSGEGMEHTRYLVVHVKQDGKWQMASARDLPDEEASAREELKQLGWMVGHWVNENPDAIVITSYRWADDHCAILGEFQIQVAGRPALMGTLRIGWDPVTRKIHSWVFDSNGGSAEGVWTRNGKQWITKMTGVTRDGLATSSTNITTHMKKGHMTWQSRDRVVGKELLPNIGEIVIVKKPPQPIVSASQSTMSTSKAGENSTGESK